jgi:hypothetical protein
LGDTDGNKYPPFLVLKTKPAKEQPVREENTRQRRGFGKILWKEIKKLEELYNILIFGNKTGWWKGEISIEFLEYHFGQRANKANDPILLLWDDFSAHWTDDVKEKAKELNVHLLKIPPKCTSVCQPADIAWNRTLKHYIRGQWVEYLRRQIRTKPSVGFQMGAPNRCDVIDWIMNAWNGLSSTTIQNGFQFLMFGSDPKEKEINYINTDYQDVVERLQELELAEKVGEVQDHEDVVDRVYNSTNNLN